MASLSLHTRLNLTAGWPLWEQGFLPPLAPMRQLFLDLPLNAPSGLPWVEDNELGHRFTMFTQTMVGKMLLEHAPHHCTVHLPPLLPFELPHAKAKAREDYPSLEQDIAKYKCREARWKDMVWQLWQLSHVHEMGRADEEALPIPLSPLSFRETVCSRSTLDLLHEVEGAVQAQLLLLPKDKELTHEKAVHGKTAGHLSEEKLQRGILAEKHAVKELWLYPDVGTALCPATAEFIIDQAVINISATTAPRRHWEKCLRELFSYAALAREQGFDVRQVALFYPFSHRLIRVPIDDWDHRALFDRLLNTENVTEPLS